MSNFRFKISLRSKIPNSAIDPEDIGNTLCLTPEYLYKIGQPRFTRFFMRAGGFGN